MREACKAGYVRLVEGAKVLDVFGFMTKGIVMWICFEKSGVVRLGVSSRGRKQGSENKEARAGVSSLLKLLIEPPLALGSYI